MRPLSFALLVLAVITAASLERHHRSVARALALTLCGAVLEALPLPRPALLALHVVAPAAILGAAWGALQGVRGWVAVVAIFVVTGGAVVSPELTREQLGETYAALWGLAALGAAAACYETLAPRATRLVMLALLGGLLPEALGWVAWGRAIHGGYELARAASCLSLAVVVVVQVLEVRRLWSSDRLSSQPPSSA